MGRKKVEYICKKCGYKTNKKSSYILHLNKKTPCTHNKINNIESITSETISINNIYEEKLNKIQLENEKLKLENIKYKVEYEQIKKKLDEERNESKNSIKELITTNKNLSQEMKKYKETIKINMTNYIVINSYGKEQQIDMKPILNDCKTLAEMIAQSIKTKHFSKNKKNHNLMLLRTIAKTYNSEGVWEQKDNIKLFIVNELIKKGVVNIDDYKKSENIKFEKKKENRYKKDKKYLIRNVPLPCMFNPTEAKKRLKEIQEERESDIDPKDEQWDNIELKYKKEIKTASKQLDVKNNLIKHLNDSVSKKDIKAGMVGYRYM